MPTESLSLEGTHTHVVDKGQALTVSRRVSIRVVFIVIVIVAILALATTVLVFSRLDRSRSAPTIVLCCLSGGGRMTPVHVQVFSAAPELPLAEFRAVLLADGVTNGELNPLREGVDRDLRFYDVSGQGRLSHGDMFPVSCSFEDQLAGCNSSWPSGAELRIYWAGTVVANYTFNP